MYIIAHCSLEKNLTPDLIILFCVVIFLPNYSIKIWVETLCKNVQVICIRKLFFVKTNIYVKKLHKRCILNITKKNFSVSLLLFTLFLLPLKTYYWILLTTTYYTYYLPQLLLICYLLLFSYDLLLHISTYYQCYITTTNNSTTTTSSTSTFASTTSAITTYYYHYLLLATHYSLLTTYHLLPTTTITTTTVEIAPLLPSLCQF